MSETATAPAATPEKAAIPAAAAAPAATPEAKPAATPAAAEPAKAAEPAAAEPKKTSIIGDAGKVEAKTGEAKPAAPAETAEAKTEREATEKRLMETPDKDLNADDLAKKQALVKAAEDAKSKTVPEKYEIKVPEGMTLDAAVLEKFTPIAKELGLTNEQVQKLADFQLQQITTAQQAQQKSFEDFVEKTTKDTETFFGSKLEGELPYVAKGRDNFADPEVMELLDGTGLSNHKAFIRMFAKMGRAVSEDKLVEGKPATTEDTRTDGQIVYAKDKK